MNTSNTLFKKIFFLLFFVLLIQLANAQKIGLLMDSYVNERWLVDEKFFVDRINHLGGEVQVEVANGDPEAQLALAKKLIREGAQVLVVVPCDAKKATEIVAIAHEAKVPVVSYDRLIMNREIALYASYDNRAVGRLQAEYVTNQVPEGSYLLLNGPTSDHNAVLFRKAQLAVLKPKVEKGEIKILGDIVLDSWSEIEAMMHLEEYFLLNEQVPDVIIAANDALANAAVEALKSNEIGKKVFITGQDADVVALRNILSGKQVMTIYKPIKPLAFLAAEAAWKLAKGEEIGQYKAIDVGGMTVHAVLLDPTVVDKTNYKATVVKDGHVFLSEILNK